MESRPTRGAWIEMLISLAINRTSLTSRPTRGAWIEMTSDCGRGGLQAVAPHTGRVD